MHKQITWPAILHIENDDLLYYLASAEALNDELENHFLKHADACTLLDFTGQQFSLSLAELKQTKKTQSSSTYNLTAITKLGLEEFNQMVRNHLSARQQCCVLKVSINSFAQGFQLIRDTAEE